jgi:hypothetical protein
LGGTEILLDPGVHAFLVDLHALQVQVAHQAVEMARGHLLVMLDPTRGGTDLIGDIEGVERLDLKRIGRCHRGTLRTRLVRFGSA